MITDEEVMRLFERADPARVDDAAPVVDATGYLATLRTKSSNVTLIDTEPTRTGPANRHRRVHITVAAAAVVAILVVAFVLAGRGGPTEPQIPAGTTVVPQNPEAAAAEQIARQFVAARDAWDGETVRSLVADDAVIDDSSGAAVDDYLARSEFERILEWRFQQPQCATTAVGPPAEVTCTYSMQNVLSRALGVGPFTGSSFEFEIADGQIQQVIHKFDFSQYGPQALDVFWEWLDDAHPGDTDVMFETDAAGYSSVILTPEALALFEERVPQFEAVGTAIRFVEARDAWDGETVRSLVADDAAIDDFAVATVDDYLANAEFERITGWRYLQPACIATVAGPPAEVTCTYVMQDILSEALDVGPYTGSSFEFVIADGQIRQVRNRFDYSLYAPQAFEVFTDWLDEAHPGDSDVMLDTIENGDVARSTTPESLALWEQRIPEWVSSLNGS